jgi:hypothetical protein
VLKLCSGVAIALGALGSAQALPITANDIKADYENAAHDSSFSVQATSPWTNPVTLGLKSQDGYTGVGVQGMTDGEIDWRDGRSESITLNFAQSAALSSFTLGVLFNGPEYNDVREVARITVNGDSTSYYLRTQATEDLAQWFYGNTFLSNVSFVPGAGTQNGQGGVVSVFNPFGNTAVSNIRFEASQGVSGNRCGQNGTSVCTNQSDYSVVSVNRVPEPQTLGLMLAGMAALGFTTRRRPAR